MRKIEIPFFIFLIIGIIGLLNYIPIFYCPAWLNLFYFNYKIVIIVVCFIFLLILTILEKNKKNKIIFLFIYLLALIFSKQIREIDNKFIVKINEQKDISEIYAPILGYQFIKAETNNKHDYDIDFDVLIKFNANFGDYDALVYKKNHKLNMNSLDGDCALFTIYNDNWWWYKHR